MSKVNTLYMKGFQFFFFFSFFVGALNAQTLTNKLVVDTSFIYTNYIYKDGLFTPPKDKVKHLFTQTEGYIVKNLLVYDGVWASTQRRCYCEVDMKDKTVTLNMPDSYPKLTINYDLSLKIDGSIDFDKSVWEDSFCGNNIVLNYGSLYPEKADKVILSVNLNPLLATPSKLDSFLFTNRILEGYGLVFKEDKKVYPIIFRCLLTQKSENN